VVSARSLIKDSRLQASGISRQKGYSEARLAYWCISRTT
jgi:hypothetical protein